MALGLCATVFVLGAVLVFHIYAVTHKPKSNEPVVQLSRIDFLEHIDSTEAIKIRYTVAAMEGVQSTYFNFASNILVYTYTIDKQSSTAVFNALMKTGTYKAKRYIVNPTDLSKGCPVGASNQSLSGKATAYLTSLFN